MDLDRVGELASMQDERCRSNHRLGNHREYHVIVCGMHAALTLFRL